MNVIFGTSGAAREIDWLISDIQQSGKPVRGHTHFVGLNQIGSKIQGKEVINESNFFNRLTMLTDCSVYLGFGDGLLRRIFFNQLVKYTQINFPSLVHPSIIRDERPSSVQFGKGTFIAAGNVLMCNIKIGEFNYLNIGNTIGHDCEFGDFVTISPGCRISGNVQIGHNTFIGTGAIILDKVTIAHNTIIGAGCVVNKSINEPGTYVGVPARKLK
ncbi:MAG: acetyltransferase [bacterium]|nr:acetyltransferase [bacterium]